MVLKETIISLNVWPNFSFFDLSYFKGKVQNTRVLKIE